ncbi:hypothetical protein DXG03_001306, partial [Asterophora parasitica]
APTPAQHITKPIHDSRAINETTFTPPVQHSAPIIDINTAATTASYGQQPAIITKVSKKTRRFARALIPNVLRRRGPQSDLDQRPVGGSLLQNCRPKLRQSIGQLRSRSIPIYNVSENDTSLPAPSASEPADEANEIVSDYQTINEIDTRLSIEDGVDAIETAATVFDAVPAPILDAFGIAPSTSDDTMPSHDTPHPLGPSADGITHETLHDNFTPSRNSFITTNPLPESNNYPSTFGSQIQAISIQSSSLASELDATSQEEVSIASNDRRNSMDSLSPSIHSDGLLYAPSNLADPGMLSENDHDISERESRSPSTSSFYSCTTSPPAIVGEDDPQHPMQTTSGDDIMIANASEFESDDSLSDTESDYSNSSSAVPVTDAQVETISIHSWSSMVSLLAGATQQQQASLAQDLSFQPMSLNNHVIDSSSISSVLPSWHEATNLAEPETLSDDALDLASYSRPSFLYASSDPEMYSEGDFDISEWESRTPSPSFPDPPASSDRAMAEVDDVAPPPRGCSDYTT